MKALVTYKDKEGIAQSTTMSLPIVTKWTPYGILFMESGEFSIYNMAFYDYQIISIDIKIG